MADNKTPTLIVDPATAKAYEDEKNANRERRITTFLKDIKAVCDEHEIDLVPILNTNPKAIVAAIGISIRDEHAEERQ
jgi:hypothetical protein